MIRGKAGSIPTIGQKNCITFFSPIDETRNYYYENIKTTVMKFEGPVLAIPDVQKALERKTDASAHALGPVLWQDSRLVAYHSEMFNTALLNYPTYEKETLY
ncbi:hypothetical protein RJ640_029071 [Escallonia rubra]|uniref:Reverse transcriptase/retrotransposon-derived protein RNase H-like domain-containing protein n=1 Tax=Escallonia rubra TaxID=112253 RepID=A0AA88S0H7_9ASTE|nr:hypothetical protein RJ640_029071 [Escallonia rubra]